MYSNRRNEEVLTIELAVNRNGEMIRLIRPNRIMKRVGLNEEKMCL